MSMFFTMDPNPFKKDITLFFFNHFIKNLVSYIYFIVRRQLIVVIIKPLCNNL